MLLRIVTMEGIFLSEQVQSTTVPGIEGELGILPDHAPLVTRLEPGELDYRRDGGEHIIAVGEGLIEVTQDQISILTEFAVTPMQIDEEAEEQAVARAEKKLKDGSGSSKEIATVRAALARSLAKLKVKRAARN